MTTKIINILPQILATKIAAGEVVDRPASVVKELMENSIDSGATEISVYIEEGGRNLIKIVDNGCGMSAIDAPTAFKRHATSKLATERDLENIHTMGFRGEALPSVASVSRVTVRTKEKGQVSGTKVIVEGGGECQVSSDGCPEGTVIEVRDLFYNTPARYKFLRSAQTEYGYISDAVKRIVLAHPSKRFRFVNNGKTVIDARSGDLKSRIGELFGRDVIENVIEVKSEVSGADLLGGDPKAINITGYVGRPDVSYTTLKGMNVYINGRWVRDKAITRAAVDGFRGTIEHRRYPFVVLNIDFPYADIDVNVHPAKSEVKFKNPSAIFNAVKSAVSSAVGSVGIGGSGGLLDDRGGRPLQMPGRSGSTPSDAPPSYRPAPNYSKGLSDAIGGNVSSGGVNASARETYRGVNEDVIIRHDEINSQVKADFKSDDSSIVTPEFLEMEVVGQIWGEFLVTELPSDGQSDAEFFMIDQHGAAERVAFEKLKKQFHSDDSPASQGILVPEKIETTPKERDAMNECLPMLTKLGFEIEPFGTSTKEGGETYMVKAVPRLLEGRGTTRLLKDLVEDVGDAEIVNVSDAVVDEKLDSVFMRIACHSVIRGATILSKEQSKALLKEMARIDFSAYCPHGRPVVKRFTRKEVDTMFGRH